MRDLAQCDDILARHDVERGAFSNELAAQRGHRAVRRDGRHRRGGERLLGDEGAAQAQHFDGERLLCDAAGMSEHMIRTVKEKNNAHVQHGLIALHAHCGDVQGAKWVFEGIGDKHKDAVSINCMMHALLHNECCAETLGQARLRDDRSHMYAITACAQSRDFERGAQLVEQLLVTGQEQSIDFLGKSGQMDAAKDFFRCIDAGQRSTLTFNSLMMALCESGCHGEALCVYTEMETDEVARNDVSHLLALKAYMYTLGHDEQRGRDICDAVRRQRSALSTELRSLLIHFFERFGDVEAARGV